MSNIVDLSLTDEEKTPERFFDLSLTEEKMTPGKANTIWLTKNMLAVKYGCSVDTISRRVNEMEASGDYPGAVRRIKGIEVDSDQFEHFCTYGRRKAGKVVPFQKGAVNEK